MTWNANLPDAAQSPSLWPPQSQGNNGRLQTMFSAEHQFNNTSAANDGVHKQMTLVSRADPTFLPSGTNGMIYQGTDGLPRYYDGITVFQLTPVRARVTFDNIGTIQGPSFNVASVAVVSTGIFKITFTTPLPTRTFQYSLNGLTISYAGATLGNISLVTGTAPQVTSLNVLFFDTSNDHPRPITFGSLIIFGG
jgi:hypothetical protein